MGLPISTVNLVLKTASATKQGFGTPLFQAPSMGSLKRVMTFSSLPAVAEVYSTNHPAYKAARGYLSNTPSVPKFKIGKVLASLVLTPDEIVSGKIYSFTISDGVTQGVCTYTAAGGDTEEDVVDDLLADIAGFTSIAANVTATKVGTGAAATLSLVATGDFTITKISNLVEAYTTTETPVQSLAAIRAEDDDFWFLNSYTRNLAEQDALSAEIQATSKAYFSASSDPVYLANTLEKGTRNRTAGLWSHDVSEFPECVYVGENAPYSPDERSVVWDGRALAGVPVAQDPVSGNPLSETQRGYLDALNSSYVADTSVGPRILGGKMVDGSWIDDIRTQDTIIARVQEALDTLILNQKGGKVVGGARGLALVDSAITKALTPFVKSNAIESFTTDTSAATIDQGTRTLSNVIFNVVLAGAILRVVVNGTAVNQEV